MLRGWRRLAGVCGHSTGDVSTPFCFDGFDSPARVGSHAKGRAAFPRDRRNSRTPITLSIAVEPWRHTTHRASQPANRPFSHLSKVEAQFKKGLVLAGPVQADCDCPGSASRGLRVAAFFQLRNVSGSIALPEPVQPL